MNVDSRRQKEESEMSQLKSSLSFSQERRHWGVFSVVILHISIPNVHSL